LVVLGRVQGEVAEQFAILTEDPDIEVAHKTDSVSSFRRSKVASSKLSTRPYRERARVGT